MTRRYELDWLRVLLFALLVPHHVAVGFVDWGVDIYQFVNNDLAGCGMTLFLYWSHSWRLPSLFLIAGIGTWFLTKTGVGPRFIRGRLLRLLVPAAFGVAFLNVFGGYAIARMTSDPPGFFAFWWRWLTEPQPRQVQHLWFLFNLSIYTILCWPIFAWVPADLQPANATVFSIVEAATAWAWCLAALGLSVRFLNQPGRLLSELNRAVFPFYILHFPVTIIGLAIAAQLSWSWPVEFLALLIFVYGVTWLLWRFFDGLSGPAAYLVGGKPARHGIPSAPKHTG